MQQDDPWSLDARSRPARTEPKVELQIPTSLEDALLAIDYKASPVFAVLDGAQFDNLPQELLLGGFVSRPLYLDRGDNNAEQIIAAPHMVWLEERSEKVTGRAPKETVPALMALIAGRPAAVFWQCPDGADALYKHLRGINLVMIPTKFVPRADSDRFSNDQQDPPPHKPVLFRHADANVIAQTLPAMDAAEMARFYGPANRLFLASDPDWANGRDWLEADRSSELPKPQSGLTILSAATMEGIKHARERRSLQRTAGFLRRTLPRDFQGLSDHQLDQIVRSSRKSGKDLGIFRFTPCSAPTGLVWVREPLETAHISS